MGPMGTPLTALDATAYVIVGLLLLVSMLAALWGYAFEPASLTHIQCAACRRWLHAPEDVAWDGDLPLCRDDHRCHVEGLS